MKSCFTILSVVVAGLLLASLGASYFLEHAGRGIGRDLGRLIGHVVDRLSPAPDPLIGADFIGRYEPGLDSFTFRQSGGIASQRVKAPDFVTFFQSSPVSAPKIVIIWNEGTQPVPASKSAFEDRARAALASAGASVRFIEASDTQLAEGLFPDR